MVRTFLTQLFQPLHERCFRLQTWDMSPIHLSMLDVMCKTYDVTHSKDTADFFSRGTGTYIARREDAPGISEPVIGYLEIRLISPLCSIHSRGNADSAALPLLTSRSGSNFSFCAFSICFNFIFKHHHNKEKTLEIRPRSVNH